MKEMIERGALGRILRVIWTWGEFRANGYYDRELWRATWRHSGGGVLMLQASHDLDLLCWMVGKPVQVTALMGNQLHSAEIEDMVCASILFEGGALASVQVTVNQPKAFSIRQIAGERGMIVMPDVQSLSNDADDVILQGSYENALGEMVGKSIGAFYQPRIQWQEINLGKSNGFNRLLAKSHLAQRVVYKIKGAPVERPHPISLMLTRFAEAISTGGVPPVTAESGRITVELINAIILSAIRRKTVTLPIDRGEYDQLFEELSAGRTQVSRYRN
jgi:predicted dehydrogenase